MKVVDKRAKGEQTKDDESWVGGMWEMMSAYKNQAPVRSTLNLVQFGSCIRSHHSEKAYRCQCKSVSLLNNAFAKRKSKGPPIPSITSSPNAVGGADLR